MYGRNTSPSTSKYFKIFPVDGRQLYMILTSCRFLGQIKTLCTSSRRTWRLHNQELGIRCSLVLTTKYYKTKGGIRVRFVIIVSTVLYKYYIVLYWMYPFWTESVKKKKWIICSTCLELIFTMVKMVTTTMKTLQWVSIPKHSNVPSDILSINTVNLKENNDIVYLFLKCLHHCLTLKMKA